MTLRFFRRVSIIPGLRVNASRSGLSLWIGRRRAWYTVGPKGHRATLGELRGKLGDGVRKAA